MARLGVWLGVAALVLQLLVPLSAPQAAWVEDGLFPPTCSVHPGDAATGATDLADCAQCPLCQLPAGDRLLPSVQRVAAVIYDAPASAVPQAERADLAPRDGPASPPLPSRGPPSAV
jgi:hypothetical protein